MGQTNRLPLVEPRNGVPSSRARCGAQELTLGLRARRDLQLPVDVGHHGTHISQRHRCHVVMGETYLRRPVSFGEPRRGQSYLLGGDHTD